ncbi:MAG: hypothetical protein AAF318_10840 [Pseudomonadota bacterium]
MYRVAILSLLVVFLAPAASWGDAWTIKRGRTLTFVTSTFTYGNHSFDANGKLVKVPEYKKFNLTASGEYGVRDWLTALVKTELRTEHAYGLVSRAFFQNPIFGGVSQDVFDHQTKTYGSLAGGARVRVLDGGPVVASVEVLAGTGGLDTLGAQAASDGPFVEARAQMGVGRDMFNTPFFASAAAAYRYRMEADDSDEILLDVTVGADVLPHWTLLAQSFTTIETEGDAFNTKVSAGVVHQVSKRLKVQASGLATVAGRNTIQEFGGSLGFWWAF